MSRPGENNSDEQRVEEAQQALAKLVCYETVSPRSLCRENGLFRRFIDALNPNMSSSFNFNSLERNCLELFKKEHVKVKEVFSKLGYISLSVNFQREFVTKDEYHCLSAHFIFNDWKLRRWVLKYGNIYDTNGSAILETLKEYDIDDKLLTLTTVEDDWESVKESMELNRNFPLSQLFHVQCCCDIVSQMVQIGFDEIYNIITKIELLVQWPKSYPLWYLTSKNLSSALKSNALGEFSSEPIDEVPSEEEWEKVRSICRLTEGLYEITRGLFQVKRPTANLFLPHIQEIRAYLAQESPSSDSFARLVTQKMLNFFNKYWDHMYLMLSIAAFLDPRYKMKFVEFCLSDDSRATIVFWTIYYLHDGYVVQCDHHEDLLSDSSSESGEEEGEEGSERHAKKTCLNTLSENLNVVKEYCQSMPSMNDKPQQSDLTLYLEEPVLPWTANFNVLHWWKDNGFKYPYLSRMARDFLAIPMSVTTSHDDAYYTGIREADSKEFSLKPILMNALKCTRTWKLGSRK